MNKYLIFGCGYTGRRVAARLLRTGAHVIATTRDPATLDDLGALGCEVVQLDVLEAGSLEAVISQAARGCRVLLSIPPINTPQGLVDLVPRIVDALGDRPRCVVYLSTTGIYGNARLVDQTTPIAPVTQRQRLRAAAEQAVTGGPWTSMILRPAAIYGPGRGVHTSMRQGRFRLAGDGRNFVSRIQVDDLASLATAALQCSATGAYPVADEEPCASRDIAEFCARLLGLPLPGSVTKDEVSETRRSDRRVDGGAIRRLLGVDLKHPSYRTGIPAALVAEADAMPSGGPSGGEISGRGLA
jgi:nucleoside-diphosphate-sugar epimerase